MGAVASAVESAVSSAANAVATAVEDVGHAVEKVGQAVEKEVGVELRFLYLPTVKRSAYYE